MKKLFCLLILLPITSFAAIKCPLVSVIQSVGLSDNLARDSNGRWVAGRSNQSYGTLQRWTFVIADIGAPNKQKAVLEANEALATLEFYSGPKIGPSGKWICLYSNDEMFPSAAITPPIALASFLQLA